MGKIEKKTDFVTKFDINSYEKKSERGMLILFNTLIFVSVLLGVFTLPYQAYPAPFDGIQTFTLFGLIIIYFMRNKLPAKVVAYAKYFWWATIAVSLIYVNFLAMTGKVNLAVTLWGDFFLFLLPLLFYGILRVTLFKGKK